MRLIPAFFLTALLVALFPLVVGAQDSGAPADTTVVEEESSDLKQAQDYLVTLTAELDTMSSLLNRAKNAEDEQFKLLRVSAQRHLDSIDDLQPKLWKLLPELDPEDPATEEIRQVTANFLIAKYDIYERAIEWWAREIETLRDQRSVTAAEDLDDLEAGIGDARDRLNTLLSKLPTIIEDAESLGVDAQQTWDRYDRAINTRAENLVGRLQISVDARENLKKKIQASEKAGAPESEIGPERARLQYAEERVKGVAQSLDATVNLLGSRGFETTVYRQFVIKTTGEISEKVLDPRVLFGLIKDGFKDLGNWLRDRGPTILVKLLIVLAVVFFFRLLFRLIWWLMRLVRMVKLTRLMVQLGNSLVTPLATIVGLFAGLWFIGANPTTLLTGAGVAGVIIGFALQDSLSNLAAGFFILATRPFDVDDVIRTGTVIGTVKAMWIANTTIVTFDGRRLLIPNRMIWADIIENRSVEPLRRADFTVRVGFEEDLDRAIAILKDLVQDEGRVLDHPGPSIFVSSWAESWVEIAVRPWARNEDWWPLLQDLPRLVVQRFAAEGIEIPYPKREMTGPQAPSSDQEAERE